MDQFITGEVAKLERDEAKAKRIIADCIKHNLIPHVSSFKTLKEVYDALKNMFEGNNINRKMTLRNQLKNVKIQNSRLYSLTSQGLLKSKNNLKWLKKMLKKEKL